MEKPNKFKVGVLQGWEVMDCLDLLLNDIINKMIFINWRAKKEYIRVLNPCDTHPRWILD